MKTHGGVEVQPLALLTWEVDGGEWSASLLGRFTPRGKFPPVPIG